MHFDLREISFTQKLLACIPVEVAQRYRTLPIFSSPESLTVALADPSDLDALDSLKRLLKRDIVVCVVEQSQLEEFIKRLYGAEDPLE